MKILVVNCGSSSLKYQLIDMEDETVMAKGLVDRIGIGDSLLSHSPSGKEKYEVKTDIENHDIAIKMVFEALVDKDHGVVADLSEIKGVGHRYVNGGALFPHSVLIDDKVMADLETTISMAPLHNGAHIIGMRACQKLMPGVPMVSVFDTSFHLTMPPKAYTYGIRYEEAERLKIRRYGAHGTSHKYVSHRAIELMGKPDAKIVTCHLGNGSSISAVDGGKCVDTSMGLTPLAGVLMGTRCGDIDASVVTHLLENDAVKQEDMNTFLNKKCGFLGVSGVSSDMREVEAAAADGNERAQRALEIFYYGVQKYIGSYAVAMGGLDAIVFTAGIGENSITARETILDGLKFLGVEVDKEANNCRGVEREITTAASKIKAFLIPTNEELAIARDTLALIKK
ncbi:MAG TPA: acetate kinase [Clostridiales bacterium]|nr:acetate kinase [Clostridiales bacterium]